MRGIVEEIGAGQPTCIPGPLPANCTGFDGGGPRNTACAQYCVEVEPFLAVPQPGAVGRPSFSPSSMISYWSPSRTLLSHSVARSQTGKNHPQSEKNGFILTFPCRFRSAGAWHDPDMLLLGNSPCSAAGAKAGMHCNNITHDEERTQLAIWSMASAPLLMSNDLASVCCTTPPYIHTTK